MYRDQKFLQHQIIQLIIGNIRVKYKMKSKKLQKPTTVVRYQTNSQAATNM